MALTILPFIQQIMTRYIISTYLAMGLIGNIFNLMVFTKQTRNRTSCSIYLIALLHLRNHLSSLVSCSTTL